MPDLTLATALGPFSIEYHAEGVTRLRMHPRHAQLEPTPLPEGPAWLTTLAEQVPRHAAGDAQDFSAVPIDVSQCGDFAQTVYRELRQVASGDVVTYGELAARVGRPTGARAVARAMSTNPIPLIVPCHRVVGANGRLTGFSGADGTLTKALLLRQEGLLPKLEPGDVVGASIFEPLVYQLAMATLKRDALFARLLETAGEVVPSPGYPENPFASLVQAVCYQQLAGAAAATIYGRLKVVLGGEPTVDRVRAADADALAGAGLSGSKRRTIEALAHAVAAGEIDLNRLATLPYPEVVRQLTAIPGIGPWTVEMFAIFHLGLPDIFSPGDLGIRKALTRLLGKATPLSPEQAQRTARRWQPFSTLATLALWRSLGTVTM